MTDRKEFFIQLKQGLVDTVQEVSRPFLEEKIEQIERATDSLLQIEWHRLEVSDTNLREIGHHLVAGEQLISFVKEEERHIISSICPTCNNLIFYFESELKLSCFTCNEQLSLKEFTGNLKVNFYPIRKQQSFYEVGITKNKLK